MNFWKQQQQLKMTLDDKITLSTSNKNRLNSNHLKTELKRLEIEKKNEFRNLNETHHRTLAKYLDANYTINEPADVKMYVTHNPGFCYTRSGQQRNHHFIHSERSVIDLGCIHNLLFNEGEIDILKLFVLHILSIYEAKYLKNPDEASTSTESEHKKNSPLEQLLERTHGQKMNITKLICLPLYVIKDGNSNLKVIEDERLHQQLLANFKILQIVHAVVTTLKKSKSDKYDQLRYLANHPHEVQAMFQEPPIQNFVKFLKNENILINCNSFVLMPKSKKNTIYLEVNTNSGELEDLLNFMYQNILQFPTQSIENLYVNNEQIMKKSFEKSNRTQTSSVGTGSGKIKSLEKSQEVKVSPTLKNTNQRTQQNTRRNQPQSSEEKRQLFTDSPTGKEVADTITTVQDSSPSTKETKVGTCDKIKVHLKRTTCPACMLKWQIAMPTPKTSHLKKNYKNTDLSSTESVRRLSLMVKEEQSKYDSYCRNLRNCSTCNYHVIGKYSNQEKSKHEFLYPVVVNLHDLEKAKQEIREKETKKKLEKFLK